VADGAVEHAFKHAFKHAFEHAFEVRLHDTDAAGVLFFGHLFRHAHDAYEALMATAGLPLQDLIRDGIALRIVHAEADYRAPMRQGDRIRVEVRVAEIRRRSFSLDYRFVHPQADPCARARTVHVLTGRGSAPVLPDDLRRSLARWQPQQDPDPGSTPDTPSASVRGLD
jgi:1,4-dihydroxy-2-naphthoyl-CoA hydrolase